MEELQSTEVLDREILEDARRKAQRLLKAADETAASAAASWTKKTEEALTKLRQNQAHRLEQSREEIMARLPLDKRRSRLEKIEHLLRNAAVSFLDALPRERLLSFLGAELVKRAGECGDVPASLPEPLAVSSRGLKPEELRMLLDKALPGAAWTSLSEKTAHPGEAKLSLSDAPGNFPAVRIDGPAWRVTVSVEHEVNALLLDKRAELAEALIGAEALGVDYA
ncbi:MAG: ATPase [Treponema sp.]|jgi:vacuolar-type H+-ATPase subunit H|nr:ATPase [Treponema sp.]